MQPKLFGRRLGIGTRVATRILREHAAKSSKSVKQESPVYAERGRAVARGTRGFFQKAWRPIAHAGGVLWLEVTGLFFAMFALFFGSSAWRLRLSYRSGPDHQRLLIYAALTAFFAYFTFSSFYRARRKARKAAR